jgi:hypothetical protein
MALLGHMRHTACSKAESHSLGATGSRFLKSAPKWLPKWARKANQARR